METNALNINPALEIIKLGTVDIVRTSSPDEDETAWIPLM